MLGQLVSMRDEEVLHAVHGRICLCWCVFFFLSLPIFFFFEREEGRSVVKASLLLPNVQRQDHRHSCAAEAITGKKKRRGDDMKRQEERQRKEGDCKTIIPATRVQFLSRARPMWTVERTKQKKTPPRTQILSRHDKTEITRLPSSLSLPPLFSIPPSNNPLSISLGDHPHQTRP